MTSFSSATRRTSRRAACALILTCALAPAAVARQQSASGDTDAAKKPATKTTAKTTTHKHPSTSSKASSTASTAKSARATHTSGKRSSHKKKSVRARGQQKIDSERATAIQQALIREHYLSGEPAGSWNQASEEAMRRYQSDHGWQTKEVPDSRALIKLGLGPSKDHLLNPESAMTTAPEALTPAQDKAAQAKPSSKPAPGPSDASRPR